MKANQRWRRGCSLEPNTFCTSGAPSFPGHYQSLHRFIIMCFIFMIIIIFRRILGINFFDKNDVVSSEILLYQHVSICWRNSSVEYVSKISFIRFTKLFFSVASMALVMTVKNGYDAATICTTWYRNLRSWTFAWLCWSWCLRLNGCLRTISPGTA